MDNTWYLLITTIVYNPGMNSVRRGGKQHKLDKSVWVPVDREVNTSRYVCIILLPKFREVSERLMDHSVVFCCTVQVLIISFPPYPTRTVVRAASLGWQVAAWAWGATCSSCLASHGTICLSSVVTRLPKARLPLLSLLWVSRVSWK